MSRLRGAVAVVTGAASGIGEASAMRLARDGAAVACTDIDSDGAKSVADRIVRSGLRALAFACDVTREESVASTLAAVERDFGAAIRILHANAGIEGPIGFVTDIGLEDWDRVVAVNLTGVFLCAKHVLPSMRRGGGGSIVITASNASLAANPQWSAYGATKGGVLALAKNLAVDHAPDRIRVNCVCPGAIETPLLTRGFAQIFGRSDGTEVLSRRGRIGRPEEVAAIVAFLASDEASLITGAAIVADFGSTARMGRTWPSENYWE